MGGPFQLVIEGVPKFPWCLGLLYAQHQCDELKAMKENRPKEWYVLDHSTGQHLFQFPSPFNKLGEH